MNLANRVIPRLLCTLSICAFTRFSSLAMGQEPAEGDAMFAIVIHGGAGGNPAEWSEEYREARRAGMGKALDRGVKMLQSGALALDVVEEVVRIMEDDPVFNAACGAVLNEQGEHELDASIMDGKTLACGAVASVRSFKHPISLARKVMTETRHVLLIGDGAEKFGKTQGLETADPSYFRTERRVEQWRRWKSKQSTSMREQNKPESYFGTVGCVVCDAQGNLAAATSTGGLMGKRWGRVGDSPIVGAGNYADNGTCAVSGTGIGEEFIRRNIAADIAARMRYGRTLLSDSAKQSVGMLPENAGGVIAVDSKGNMVVECNTVGMSHGFADSSGTRAVRLTREK